MLSISSLIQPRLDDLIGEGEHLWDASKACGSWEIQDQARLAQWMTSCSNILDKELDKEIEELFHGSENESACDDSEGSQPKP